MCISGCSPFQFSICVLLCFYVKVTFMNKYFTSVSIYLSINSLYQKRLAYTKPDCVLILRLYHEQSLHLVKKPIISSTLAWQFLSLSPWKDLHLAERELPWPLRSPKLMAK